MSDAELDNPFWSSLQSRHRSIALSCGQAIRYPAEFAPFLGVAHAGVGVADALEELVGVDESIYLLGVAPAIADGWHTTAFRPLAQMICESPLQVVDGPAVVELTEHHRDDVLALTTLVYPHYFRPRTMALGRYLGIYEDGRLAAMAGERLGMDGFQEISAICTHPDFLGRGYARRLTALLGNDNLERGRMPFLHVSHENARAAHLYQRMGFRHRRDIEFWSLRRAR